MVRASIITQTIKKATCFLSFFLAFSFFLDDVCFLSKRNMQNKVTNAGEDYHDNNQEIMERNGRKDMEIKLLKINVKLLYLTLV